MTYYHYNEQTKVFEPVEYKASAYTGWMGMIKKGKYKMGMPEPRHYSRIL